METLIAGTSVHMTDQGYLKDFSQWSPDLAKLIAKEEEIELTEDHWKVLRYLQEQYKQDVPLTIRKVGKSGIVDIKGFYSLFPGGPLKKASRIAGIPKPASCI